LSIASIVIAAAASAAADDDDVAMDTGVECRLSSHDAASADGLVIDTVNPQHNHYERIGLCLSFCLSVCLSTCLYVCLCVCVSVNQRQVKLENVT